MFEKHFGSCRFVYNYFLAKRDEYYLTHKGAKKSSLSNLDTQNTLIELKKYPWLCEVNSQSLQMSLRSLDNAFKNIFHKNGEHPRFRNKDINDILIVPQHIKIGNRICFPKFFEGIYFRGSKKMLSEIKSIKQIIITRDGGDYYCSIIYENEKEPPEKVPLSVENSVGIDMGVEKFAKLSDGIAIENPHFINRVENKIKKLQKQLSRKQKCSNNSQKTILKLRRKYRKLRNMRDDIHDKVSTAIAKRYDTIVLEELSLQGMLQNQHLLKSLLDVFFYGFRQKLEWKVHKHGKNLIKIGRFDPSSKLWSKCGNIKRDLKL